MVCVAEVFHAWQQACCFFMVTPVENVSKCLWPCSLYGKDIIHHVKQTKNIYCILVYLYNYVIEKKLALKLNRIRSLL